jgi:hypothetical protein
MTSAPKASEIAADQALAVDAGVAGAEPLVQLVELQTIPMPNGILGVAEVSKHIGLLRSM